MLQIFHSNTPQRCLLDLDLVPGRVLSASHWGPLHSLLCSWIQMLYLCDLVHCHAGSNYSRMAKLQLWRHSHDRQQFSTRLWLSRDDWLVLMLPKCVKKTFPTPFQHPHQSGLLTQIILSWFTVFLPTWDPTIWVLNKRLRYIRPGNISHRPGYIKLKTHWNALDMRHIKTHQNRLYQTQDTSRHIRHETHQDTSDKASSNTRHIKWHQMRLHQIKDTSRYFIWGYIKPKTH